MLKLPQRSISTRLGLFAAMTLIIATLAFASVFNNRSFMEREREIESAASGEQSTGIGHVNIALSQMDEVTQQNSALVEQSASAAKALEEQSAAMNESVSRFRVGADAQPLVAGRSARATRQAHSSRSSRARPAARMTHGNTALAPSSNQDWEQF